MKLLSLEPFVPSGTDFTKSKELFVAIGFNINWDAGDYIGFEKDGCKFILQNFSNRDFAENFMVSVKVDNVEELATLLSEKNIAENFGARIGAISQQPYGKELNMIDLAGVCWHFVE